MPIDVQEQLIERTPEHEAYIATLTEQAHQATEVETPQESLLKHRPERVYVDSEHQPKRLDISQEAALPLATLDSEVAQTALFVGSHVVAARNQEVALDLIQSHQNNQAVPTSRERAARLIAGDYAINLLSNIFKTSSSVQVYERQKQYLEAEAAIGGEILGDREASFYCFDEHTFVWHPAGAETNVRYIVRQHDVLKQFGDHQFSRLAGEELENFNQTIREYYHLVAERLYNGTNSETSADSTPQATVTDINSRRKAVIENLRQAA